MSKSDNLAQAEEILRLKRETANDKARSNYMRACQNAEFNKNETEIRKQQLAVGRAMYSGEKLKKEKSRLNLLYQKRLALLSELKMEKSDLISRYDCTACKDTGRINGKNCKCFDNILFGLLSESSFIKSRLDLADIKFEGKNNKKVLEFVEKFEKDFEHTSKKNLLIAGKTGTGKTYLLSALATRIMKKGFSVFFITAFNLNRLILKVHVGTLAEKDQILSSLIDADILIIDDLGSEQIYKNVTIEYLFNIINERQLADKYTFYSTNCELEELQNRYGDRIFSRLANKQNTTLLQLDSSDKRLCKN